jgi:hypothetical protein
VVLSTFDYSPPLADFSEITRIANSLILDEFEERFVLGNITLHIDEEGSHVDYTSPNVTLYVLYVPPCDGEILGSIGR